MKFNFLLIVVFAVFGCMNGGVMPFTHSVGKITIGGNDYSSALMIKNSDKGICIVGGFVSDVPLGPLTIGPNNTKDTSLQIVPSAGEIIYKGKKVVIEENAVLYWFIQGSVIRQELEGFPLEKEIVLPDTSLTNKEG